MFRLAEIACISINNNNNKINFGKQHLKSFFSQKRRKIKSLKLSKQNLYFETIII